ncbi:MAG TPA: alpha/beta hydrolase [Nitrospirae bacterium]|nr:alpha/beta hydrolase [Nitrospirota bacterium]
MPDERLIETGTLKIHLLFKKQIGMSVLLAFVILVCTTSCFSGIRERLQDRIQSRNGKTSVGTNSACDDLIPKITKGYGSNGPYDMDIKTISNPLWKRKKISVFFPKGVSDQRPVIFFSHGFGGTDWKYAYAPFIRHMVSRGYIVIFSPYQTLRATSDERYATLWNGFELAVQQFGSQMDLTRVGFVGHSFGGGATPAMAIKGLVDKGWGKKSAFMYMLAPWYSLQITSDKLRQLPGHVVLIVQVYDKDDMNDHRMAIDIFRNIQLPDKQKHFMVVRSENINGCEIVADHATPSRNPSLSLKQYGLFKPFDAVADYVFNGNSEGNKVISDISSTSEKGVYQPVYIEDNPEPLIPQKNYRFPWNDKKNVRRSLENW